MKGLLKLLPAALFLTLCAAQTASTSDNDLIINQPINYYDIEEHSAIVVYGRNNPGNNVWDWNWKNGPIGDVSFSESEKGYLQQLNLGAGIVYTLDVTGQTILDQVAEPSLSGMADLERWVDLNFTEIPDIYDLVNEWYEQTELYDYTNDRIMVISIIQPYAEYKTTKYNFLWTGYADGLSETGEPGDPSAVPEPGTLALLGVGLIGLAAYRRRNRARR